jgi:hypothetical protein
MKGANMDSLEKTRMRVEHWLRHNEDHLQEYEKLAAELEKSGKKETADHIRDMITLVTQGDKCLQLAFESLS